MIYAVCVCASLLMCAASCHRVPDDIIPQEKMAALLADLHKGEAVVDANSQTMSGDSVRRAFRQAIYAKHGYSTAQVDSSMRWYGFHMDRYVEVYDRTLEILNAELEKAQEQSGSSATATTNGYMAMEGDSVDVWTGVRSRRFSINMPSDIISFNILSEPNWEAGDIYTLRAKMLGNQQNAELKVAIDYADGSREYLSRKVIGDGWHQLAFAVDSARTAREIYGTIHYPSVQSPDRVAFIDSISLTRTRWKPYKRYTREDINEFAQRPTSVRHVGGASPSAPATSMPQHPVQEVPLVDEPLRRHSELQPAPEPVNVKVHEGKRPMRRRKLQR